MYVLTFHQREKIIKIALGQLERYVRENHLNGISLGVSGGVDSALGLALCVELSKKLNKSGCQFSTSFYFLDIESDPKDFEKASELGKKFKVDIHYHDLFSEYCSLRNLIVSPSNDLSTRIRLGNIKARLRMIVLRDIAQEISGVMLDTGSLTEHIVGFWTKAGDEGDIGVFSHLTKAEIIDLAEYMGVLQDILDSKPGDGNKVTEKSHAADQFGGLDFLYRDFIISRFIGKGFVTTNNLDQMQRPGYLTLASLVADEVGCTKEQVILVMTKVITTAFKRRPTPVINLLTSRTQLGLPDMGTQEFSKIYLSAIKKRAEQTS